MALSPPKPLSLQMVIQKCEGTPNGTFPPKRLGPHEWGGGGGGRWGHGGRTPRPCSHGPSLTHTYSLFPTARHGRLSPTLLMLEPGFYLGEGFKPQAMLHCFTHCPQREKQLATAE